MELFNHQHTPNQSLSERLEAIRRIESAGERSERLEQLVAFEALPSKSEILEESLDTLLESITSYFDVINLAECFSDFPKSWHLQIREKFFKILEELEEHWEIVNTVQALIAALPLSESEQQQILDVIWRIEEADPLLQGLVSIFPKITEPGRSATLEAISQLVNLVSSDRAKVEALVTIASECSESERLNILEQAVSITSDISDQEIYVLAGTVLIPHCQEPERLTLLQNVLERAITMPWRSAISPLDGVFAILAHQSIQPSLELIQQFLDAIAGLRHNYHQVDSLATLSPYLVTEVWEQAWKQAWKLGQEAQNYRAVEALISHIPDSYTQIKQVLTALWTIYPEENRAICLTALIPKLSNYYADLLQEALEISYQMQDRTLRVKVLVALMPCLPASQYLEVCQEVLETTRKIEDTLTRANISMLLADHLLPSLVPEVLQDTLTTILQIENMRGDRDSSLEEFTSQLCGCQSVLQKQTFETLQIQVFEAVKQCNLPTQVNIFSTSITYLPEPQQSEAIQAVLQGVEQLDEDYLKIKSLKSLAIYLHHGRSPLLQQALKVSRGIVDARTRVQGAIALADCLPATSQRKESLPQLIQESHTYLESQDVAGEYGAQLFAALVNQVQLSQPELLDQVLGIMATLKDPTHFEWVSLINITFKLANSQRSIVLSNALDAEKKMESGWDKYYLLKHLASTLRETDSGLIQNVITASQGLADTDRLYSADVLATLLPQLSELKRQDVFHEILSETAVAAIIADRGREEIKTEIITSLVPYLKYDQSSTFENLQRLTVAISNYEYRAIALTSLAIHSLDPGIFNDIQQILKIIEQVKDEWIYPNIFKAIAPLLPKLEPSLVDKLCESADEIKSDSYRAKSLTMLVPYLQNSQRVPVIKKSLKAIQAAVKSFENEMHCSEMLAILAPNLSISNDTELLQSALTITQNLRNEDHRIQSLKALIPRMSDILIPDLLKVALELVDKERQFEILNILAIRFPEEIAVAFPDYLLSLALKIVEQLSEDFAKIRFLSSLAPRLSAGLFPDALRFIKKEFTRDSSCQAELLNNLVPYLLEDQFSEALNLVEKEIEDEFYKAEVLSNLVLYLSLEQLPEALKIIQDFLDKSLQFNVLAKLSSRLSNSLDEQSQLLSIESISDNSESQLLDSDTLKPSPSSSVEELRKELENIYLKEGQYQAESFASIVPKLLPHPELLEEALINAREIQYEVFRAQAIIALISPLPPSHKLKVQNLKRILEIVRQIPSEESTPDYINGDLNRKLGMTNWTWNNYADDKVRILTAVLPHLHSNSELLERALKRASVKEIKNEKYLAQALAAIVSELPASYPELLQVALETTLQLQDEKNRKSIIQKFKHLLPIALAQQILKILKDSTDKILEQGKAEILCNLIPTSLSIRLEDVVAIINKIQDEGYKANAIEALVISLSKVQEEPVNKTAIPSENQKIFDEVLSIVSRFRSVCNKARIYSTLASKLLEAEDLVRTISSNHSFMKTKVLVEIASGSYEHRYWSQALGSIGQLDNSYFQFEYIKRMTSHLSSEEPLSDIQHLEAKLIAQSIQEPYYSAKALISLAYKIPKIRQDARQAVETIKEYPVQYIELLSGLATEVPEALPDIVKGAKEAIIEPLDRKYVLVALQPHLPARIVREIDRERKAGRQISDELWNRALKQLARSYREALKSGGLRNDETLDQDLLNLRDEINSLTNLLLLRDLEPPMVVGILGNWGGGKSYIMHLMQFHMVTIRSQVLEQQEAWSDNPYSENLSPYVGHIYQIKFDAWSFAKSNLWASLMRTIFFELNRQISLEQSLQAIGIDPLDDYGNEIWKVLYKTSEDDRQYFLEQILGKDKLEELKAKSQRRSESWTELLWEQYGVTETIASTYLSQKEKELNDVREQLERAKKEKEAILSNLKSKDKQENWISDLLQETTELSGFLIRKYFGKDVAEALKKEVEQKLKKEDIDVSDLNKMAMVINRTVTDIIEEDTIYIGEDKKKYSLSWLALKKWLKKNQKPIIAFVLSITLSIILPTVVAQIKSLNIVSQLAALITPLIPAIGFAQALFKSNQKWFTQARQSIQDYEDTLKQRSQDKYHNLIDERVMVNLRQLDAEVQNLTLQEQTLQQQVEQAEAALPKDSFASLANFVKARVEEATYDNHLGIMHQVRQDLIKLSQALLAPSASSTEYKIKLEKLKKFFPRGPARIVVYIDDLDRCPPDRVVEVLEAIQLLVKTPLFIAVLAIDERYIIRALEKHYAGVLSRRGRPSGEDYLEKIIQIPYRVRPISASALENYLRSQVVIQDTATGGTKFSEVSRDEFNLLLDCCRYVDLSPRTIKRLTNVYKVFKVVCRTRGTKPSRKVQQAIIALLVLSGRHTNLMREVFADMEAHYEGKGSGEQETIWKLINNFYESNCSLIGDSYSQREFDRFKQDALTTQLIPRDLTLALLTYDLFNLVRSFSFVGDVGYAAEDFRSVARAESVDQ
jgi:predicted KAP-like P-loop ATPase